MNRIVRIPAVRATALAVAAALALLSFGACSSGEDEEAAAAQAARQTRLEELAKQQADVQALRDDLVELRARLEQAETGELPEGEDVDVTALRTEIEQKDAELTDEAGALNQALTEFINADPPVEGDPVPPATERAISMKADEDVVLAGEYITEGGDYGRALTMYDNILAYSPDNPNVLEAKAEAERLRYMDEERFSQVEKGMTEAEVRGILGRANALNRRNFDDVGRAAWYYPKSPDGDAAGVLFRKKDGRFEVYDTKWNAVPKKAAGDEDAE
jgi:hypothetical protein